MPDPERGQCWGCGADVLWVHTAATGALMPVDASPDPAGNVVLRDGLAHVLAGGLFDEAASIANHADMLRHGTRACGKNHPKAKLKDVDIPVILLRASTGHLPSRIALDYGVSRTRIRQVIKKGGR